MNEPIGREEGHALLCKTGPAFVYYHPVRDGVRVDAAFEALAADIAERLSAKVFAAAPVEVHMCDQKLATLKIVTDR